MVPPDPDKDSETMTIITQSAEETRQLGFRLAGRLAAGDCLALIGELGAGKTTLVQGLARGLGVEGPVRSPSFLLVQEYAGRIPLYHVDAYRLQSAEELREIGFEEYLEAGGVVVVEWADRVAPLLPPGCLRVTLEVLDRRRRQITITVEGPAVARKAA